MTLKPLKVQGRRKLERCSGRERDRRRGGGGEEEGRRRGGGLEEGRRRGGGEEGGGGEEEGRRRGGGGEEEKGKMVGGKEVAEGGTGPRAVDRRRERGNGAVAPRNDSCRDSCCSGREG